MSVPSALAGALPETIVAWNALTDAAAAIGGTFTLNDFGGVRTPADTTLIEGYRQTDFQQAIDSGSIPADTTLQQFRPIAPYGKSYHDYGAAFDVTAHGISQRQLGALAPSCGLRWGGTWTNADPAHFELAISLADASARWGNWVSSGQQSDALSTTQQVEVAVQDPSFWALLAAVSYTAFVVYRAIVPKVARYVAS